MADAFPVTFNRMKAHLKAKPGVELIVVDPRRTNTANYATLYVPVAPGGDIPADERRRPAPARARCRGSRLPSLRTPRASRSTAISSFTPTGKSWSSAAGVPEALIHALADRLARSRALLTFYCQGLNQSTVGMWKNNSIINLHLLTGQIGKPGAGPFSLTGQPNAMGGRRKPGCWRRRFRVTGSRGPPRPRRGRGVLGTTRGNNLDEAGLTAVEMSRALEAGRLKAIWDRGHQSHGQPPRPASSPARPVRGPNHRGPGPLPPRTGRAGLDAGRGG